MVTFYQFNGPQSERSQLINNCGVVRDFNSVHFPRVQRIDYLLRHATSSWWWWNNNEASRWRERSDLSGCQWENPVYRNFRWRATAVRVALVALTGSGKSLNGFHLPYLESAYPAARSRCPVSQQGCKRRQGSRKNLCSYCSDFELVALARFGPKLPVYRWKHTKHVQIHHSWKGRILFYRNCSSPIALGTDTVSLLPRRRARVVLIYTPVKTWSYVYNKRKNGEAD